MELVTVGDSLTVHGEFSLIVDTSRRDRDDDTYKQLSLLYITYSSIIINYTTAKTNSRVQYIHHYSHLFRGRLLCNGTCC